MERRQGGFENRHAAGQCQAACSAKNKRRYKRQQNERTGDDAKLHSAKTTGTSAAPVISHWELYLSFYYYDL